MLLEWEREIGPYSDFDLVYWNNGLWDVARIYEEDVLTTLEQYEQYIVRIYKLLRKLCPNAHIIFATTTSVVEHRYDINFSRKNDDIKRYNDMAKKTIIELGGEVDDLYAMTKGWEDMAWKDATHFNDCNAQKIAIHICNGINEYFKCYVERCEKEDIFIQTACEEGKNILQIGDEVALWGIGKNYEENIGLIEEYFKIMVVSDLEKGKDKFVEKYKVVTPDEIYKDASKVIIMVTNPKFQRDMILSAVKNGLIVILLNDAIKMINSEESFGINI